MWNDGVMFENEFLSEWIKKNMLCVLARKKNIDVLMI
jgi:hypothetical protein